MKSCTMDMRAVAGATAPAGCASRPGGGCSSASLKAFGVGGGRPGGSRPGPFVPANRPTPSRPPEDKPQAVPPAPPQGTPALVRKPERRPVAVEDPRGTAVLAPQGTPALVRKPAPAPRAKFPGVLITTPVILPSAPLQTGQTAADVTPSPSQDLVSSSYCDRPENRGSELCMDPRQPSQKVPGTLVQAPLSAQTKTAGWPRAYRSAGDLAPCGRPESISEADWNNMTRLRQQDYIDQCEAARRQDQTASDNRRLLEAGTNALNTTASTITNLVRANQDYLLARRRLENEAQARELAASLDRQRQETETALRQLQATPGAGSDSAMTALVAQLTQQLAELRAAAQETAAQAGMSTGTKVALGLGVAALLGGGAWLYTRKQTRDNPGSRRRRARGR